MIGIVAQDLADSLAFFRLAGLDIPDGNSIDLFAPLDG